MDKDHQGPIVVEDEDLAYNAYIEDMREVEYPMLKGMSMSLKLELLLTLIRCHLPRPCWNHSVQQKTHGSFHDRYDVQPIWQPA